MSDVSSLRAMAHPVRLRMLSVLTGTAMSAADLARTLDISHANASYHLRQLADAGEVVEAGEQKIRGGTAKLYRYPHEAEGPRRDVTNEDRLVYTRAVAARAGAPHRRPACPGHPAGAAVRPRGLGRARGLGPGVRAAARGVPAPARRQPATAHPGHRPRQLHRLGLPDGRGRRVTGRGDALATLREPNFRYYFLSRLVNGAGSTMAAVALAFAVLEVSHSPTALGVVLAAREHPAGAVPAGRRRDRRPVRPHAGAPGLQRRRRTHPAGGRRPGHQRRGRAVAARGPQRAERHRDGDQLPGPGQRDAAARAARSAPARQRAHVDAARDAQRHRSHDRRRPGRHRRPGLGGRGRRAHVPPGRRAAAAGQDPAATAARGAGDHGRGAARGVATTSGARPGSG